MSHSAAAWPACWCGAGPAQQPHGADYRRCHDCGTLVSVHAGKAAHYMEVDGDESGHYGADYWLRHVPEDLGQPPLAQRAASDLAGRCVDWLTRTVAHCPPPASALELGCAHGAFVYLLKLAGYRAAGLDMSPTVNAMARQRFGIDVHRGPLEQAAITDRFDLIAAFDLLEHLALPRATLAACLRQLEPGGSLLLQTPCYRREDLSWSMLLAEDHLFLFTPGAARRLLHESGFQEIVIEDGFFAHDMWIAARKPGKRPRVTTEPTPIAGALIALHERARKLEAERDAIDADRHAKDEVMRHAIAERDAIDADRQAKDEVMRRAIAERDAIDADRQAKDEVMRRAIAERDAIDADRQAKDEVMRHAIAERDAIDADRQAKDEIVRSAIAERDAIDADRHAKDEVMRRVIAERDAIDADRHAKDEVMRRVIAERDAIDADRHAKDEVMRRVIAERDALAKRLTARDRPPAAERWS